jgi:predicted Zn-dependent protease
MSRRAQIEAMLKETPDDTFLQYALAMELKSEGQHEASLKLFDSLMASEPPHVPAFFMAGQQLAGLDRIEEAQQILKAGIQQADLQGNAHASGEMTEFLMSLE